MADRFPSLEEFDSGVHPEVQDLATFETADVDDFLSREKALLGDDADQFTSGQGNIEFLSDGPPELLYEEPHQNEDEAVIKFESSFPDIDSRNQNATSGVAASTYQPSQLSQFLEDEPEPIRQWRERRDLQLAERIAISEERKQGTIKIAQQNIDEFYENYNAKKEKGIAQTRREAEEFLNNREDTSAGGTSWERIAKLVNLSGKGIEGGANGTNKSRFRDLLLSLKKDDKAPGASGY
ncbi:Putative Clathrin light chain [Blumeria hordei DH14]|uniref:Clathrin light chain n=1 Tax=Blumeria graminis f. sp. hordei (strain DH14) TaxID=546991 RepID=N1JM15_BLUG1|nr:Putative Clathrin light chain [Blumeria hordei DH14]